MLLLTHNFLLFDRNGCSQLGGFGSFQGVHKILNSQKNNFFSVLYLSYLGTWKGVQ